MRIATFNVENLDTPVAPRTAVLRPALERLDADILCLQEVNGQHVPGRRDRTLQALDELVAGTRYAAYHRASTTAEAGSGAADVHNLVTLSRAPMLSMRQVRHEMVPPPSHLLQTAVPRSTTPMPLRFERPMLVTEHGAGGRHLTIVNAHLRAPLAVPVPGQKLAPFHWRSVGGWAEGLYLAALKRNAQAVELRLLIDEMLDRDPDALVLVTGDFNAEDHETPLRIVIGAAEDTGNRALAGRAMVLLDRGIAAERRYSVLHHGRPQMLDHMLASHALYGHFRSIDVHNETLGDEVVGYAKGLEPAGSGHAALVAFFEL